jgi:hypothetical protein
MRRIKTISKISFVIVALAVTGALYLLQPRVVSSPEIKPTPEQIEAIKDTGVQVPADVTKICSAKYWSDKNADGQIKDCTEYPREIVCAYHKETIAKVTGIVNREYTSECDACLSYGEDGKTEYEGVKYELLGYKTGKCYQGVYAQPH